MTPAPRYALQADFADLFAPASTEAALQTKAAAWHKKHLNAWRQHGLPLCAVVRREEDVEAWSLS